MSLKNSLCNFFCFVFKVRDSSNEVSIWMDQITTKKTNEDVRRAMYEARENAKVNATKAEENSKGKVVY